MDWAVANILHGNYHGGACPDHLKNQFNKRRQNATCSQREMERDNSTYSYKVSVDQPPKLCKCYLSTLDKDDGKYSESCIVDKRLQVESRIIHIDGEHRVRKY